MTLRTHISSIQGTLLFLFLILGEKIMLPSFSSSRHSPLTDCMPLSAPWRAVGCLCHGRPVMCHRSHSPPPSLACHRPGDLEKGRTPELLKAPSMPPSARSRGRPVLLREWSVDLVPLKLSVAWACWRQARVGRGQGGRERCCWERRDEALLGAGRESATMRWRRSR